MNATKSQLKTQYERAKRLGWISFFQEAANTITKNYFDTADLMAIGSRETNLDPKWLTKKGDNGHGAGLMQIDDRSFPDFTNSDKWKDARLGILYGAKVLMQKWNDLQSNVGKPLKVKSYTFTGPSASGVVAQQIAIAAYNSGRWAAYHFSKHRHPDHGTTGKDYSKDVIARAKVFRELLAKDFPSSTAAGGPPASSPVVSKPSEHTVSPAVSPQQTAQSTGDKQPIETTVTREEDGVTVAASKPNEQDVNVPAQVSRPEAYQGVGFWAVVKRDLAAATGGNLSLAGLTEYAQQASGWPEWIIAIISKLAVGVLIATIGYFVFRVVHYTIDTVKKNARVRVEAESATAINRKNIEWTG